MARPGYLFTVADTEVVVDGFSRSARPISRRGIILYAREIHLVGWAVGASRSLFGRGFFGRRSGLGLGSSLLFGAEPKIVIGPVVRLKISQNLILKIQNTVVQGFNEKFDSISNLLR